MQLSGYEQAPARLDAAFAALADPTRRALLARLASGDAPVHELAAPFAMSQPAISKHLKVLERAGLISRGRDAQRRPARVEPQPIAEVLDWLEHYRQALAQRFARLDALLDELTHHEAKTTRMTPMPSKSPTKSRMQSPLAAPVSQRALAQQVRSALAWLGAHSTARYRDNLPRFGIVAPKSFGVSMANIQQLAKRLGRSHDLAEALWETGWYEARLLASFVDEPARVTSRQMDRWCRDFDNWAICDTLCFHLFDRTPHAWIKVALWSKRRDEFVKRAGFALLASLAGHDKRAADDRFIDGLRLIERAATDDRNFVKKAVNWALRRIGGRNALLRAAAISVAERLAASPNATARWNGRDALKALKR